MIRRIGDSLGPQPLPQAAVTFANHALRKRKIYVPGGFVAAVFSRIRSSRRDGGDPAVRRRGLLA